MPDEQQRQREKQPLPGSVSDQNAEEQPAANEQEDYDRKPPGSASGGDEDAEGGSSEGTQSTGDPNSAG